MPFPALLAAVFATNSGRICAAGTATRVEIDRWIEQLVDDSYSVRQEAGEKLLAAGAAARELLSEAMDVADPEMRAAARRLVVLIDRAEFDRRLEAFAADKDGRGGVTLPGWEAFRDLVGDDAASRSLFVEIQRQEGELLEQVFSADDDELQAVPWENRLLRLPPWQMASGTGAAMRPVGSCAAMLLLGSLPEGRISDTGVMSLQRMLQQPPLREAIQTAGSAHHDALRRLLVAWLVHCPNRTDQALKFRLDIASSYEMRDALPLALAIAHGEPPYLTVQPMLRGYAVLVVGQLGGGEHVGQLEPLLEDDTVCLRARTGRTANADQPVTIATVEVRDAALVAMTQLTGQNPGHYGYVNAVRQDNRLYHLATLHLESDERRGAAIEKWRSWKRRESRAEAGERAQDGAESSS